MSQPRRVLITYDGSDGAKAALVHLARRRAGLPEQMEALVLCVADVWTATQGASFGLYGLDAAPVTDGQLRAAEAAERAALRQARSTALAARQRLQAECPGWEVRAESCTDAPAWGIVKRAEVWPADLIVMGSHGRSAVGRIVLGSVSQAVVREAPCAVRVVRGRVGTRDAPACLVIGYDSSPDAEAAVQAVLERAWPAGSRVRLVTALDGRVPTAVSLKRRMATPDRGQLAWLHRMIEDPAQQLRAAGLSVSPVVKRGDPRRVLIEEAKRWEADSLFVGARGLRGIRRFLLGSVSTAVVVRAPCAVEVVRPGRVSASRAPIRVLEQARAS